MQAGALQEWSMCRRRRRRRRSSLGSQSQLLFLCLAAAAAGAALPFVGLPRRHEHLRAVAKRPTLRSVLSENVDDSEKEVLERFRVREAHTGELRTLAWLYAEAALHDSEFKNLWLPWTAFEVEMGFLQRILTDTFEESYMEKTGEAAKRMQGRYMLLTLEERRTGNVLAVCELDIIDSAPYIATLAVLPSRQREGVATALLMSCEDYCRQWGRSDVVLDVYDDNIPATTLYRRLGYQRMRPTPVYRMELPSLVIPRKAYEWRKQLRHDDSEVERSAMATEDVEPSALDRYRELSHRLFVQLTPVVLPAGIVSITMQIWRLMTR